MSVVGATRVILCLMFVAVLLLLPVCAAQADTPPPPPREYRICNESITYLCADYSW
jgi:hypothetical protein